MPRCKHLDLLMGGRAIAACHPRLFMVGSGSSRPSTASCRMASFSSDRGGCTPAIARATYDPGYYQDCLTNLKQGSSYCCQQAGGVMGVAGCTDQAARFFTAAADA